MGNIRALALAEGELMSAPLNKADTITVRRSELACPAH